MKHFLASFIHIESHEGSFHDCILSMAYNGDKNTARYVKQKKSFSS